MSPRSTAALALVLSMLLFSASFTLTKLAFRDLGPMTVGLVRFAAAAALLAAWFALTRRWERVTPADARTFAVGGLLGVTAYFALENLGVSWSTATDAALLGAAYPAIIAMLDALVNGVHISRRAWVGLGLAMAGAVGIVAGAPLDLHLTPLRVWGNVLILGSAVVWAFYTFATRDIVRRYSPFTTVAWQDAVGALGFVPLALLEAPGWRPPANPVVTWGSVAALTVLCSILAMALYTVGLRHLSTATVAASINLMPLFGLVIALLVLRESVSAWQVLSGAVVVAGVLVAGAADRDAALDAEHPVG